MDLVRIDLSGVGRGHGACEALEGPYCYRGRAETIVTAWSVTFFFFPHGLLCWMRIVGGKDRGRMG
jgi:hypothetical protein